MGPGRRRGRGGGCRAVAWLLLDRRGATSVPASAHRLIVVGRLVVVERGPVLARVAPAGPVRERAAFRRRAGISLFTRQRSTEPLEQDRLSGLAAGRTERRE